LKALLFDYFPAYSASPYGTLFAFEGLPLSNITAACIILLGITYITTGVVREKVFTTRLSCVIIGMEIYFTMI
jgi:hypothetical protein